MNLTERYKEEIDKFFQGDEIESRPEGKGHVWICKHRTYAKTQFGRDSEVYSYSYIVMETLTVEPLEGGQYEIAVRVPRCDERPGRDPYSGYIADNGYFIGRNTGGH